IAARSQTGSDRSPSIVGASAESIRTGSTLGRGKAAIEAEPVAGAAGSSAAWPTDTARAADQISALKGRVREGSLAAAPAALPLRLSSACSTRGSRPGSTPSPADRRTAGAPAQTEIPLEG